MNVNSYYDEQKNNFTIEINGRFDFNTHSEFRNAYEQAPDNTEKYTVDLSEATSIDSSALGMLLLLRDHAGGENSNVEILYCSNDIARILEISNFERLFTLKETV